MPACALIVKLPAIAPSVSATVSWPGVTPFASGTVITGVPSVWPLMVMVSVAVVVLPSPSVRV